MSNAGTWVMYLHLGNPNGDPVGVTNIQDLTNIKVFPNPVSNKLFIELDEASTYNSYTITDINHKTIMKNIPLRQGVNSLDVSILTSGNYFINYYIGNKKIETKTMIKE